MILFFQLGLEIVDYSNLLVVGQSQRVEVILRVAPKEAVWNVLQEVQKLVVALSFPLGFG